MAAKHSKYYRQHVKTLMRGKVTLLMPRELLRMPSISHFEEDAAAVQGNETRKRLNHEFRQKLTPLAKWTGDIGRITRRGSTVFSLSSPDIDRMADISHAFYIKRKGLRLVIRRHLKNALFPSAKRGTKVGRLYKDKDPSPKRFPRAQKAAK